MIRISERGTSEIGGFVLDLDIEGRQFRSLRLGHPFGDEAEAKLAELDWYFEEWLSHPTINEVRAGRAADLIVAYGRGLFEQLFAGDARLAYEAWRTAATERRIEVVGGPAFQTLHWETLCDPGRNDRRLASEMAVVRRVEGRGLDLADYDAQTPEIRVLVVTARPGGQRDVGYRTISRPLLDAAGSLPEARVRFDLLRPGTFKALGERLEQADQQGAPYHVVHFDLHGGLLSYEQATDPRTVETLGSDLSFKAGFGRFEGKAAFLKFEADQPPVRIGDPRARLVRDDEVAELLARYRVPITILNACQSGKHLGEGTQETSLGARISAKGAQCVLAMAYSVTVSAAELMMPVLYRALFEGAPLDEAVRRMRLHLEKATTRRARFNRRIDLEDWMLPVLYQRKPVRLETRRLYPDEELARLAQKEGLRDVETALGPFLGRDVDILEIERRLIARNVVLIYGGGGTGKSTLIAHLGYWWRRTGWIDAKPLVFAYDQAAWTLDAMLGQIGKAVLADSEWRQLVGTPGLRLRIVERLRSERRMLVLDNLESVTAEAFSVRNTLEEVEREAIRQFLADLVGGQTLILLGARGPVPWLEAGVLRAGSAGGATDPGYLLGGLDADAASDLAERILVREGVSERYPPAEVTPLLRLLAGHPLALQVVLPNLRSRSPAEILAGLGGIDLGAADADRTRSILACVSYSHDNLDPALQDLLEVLAPFRGALYVPGLDDYAKALAAEPACAASGLERFGEMVRAAQAIGLVHPHPDLEEIGYLAIQPTLPWFLADRLAAAEKTARRAAIGRAARAYLRRLGPEIAGLIRSRAGDRVRFGLAFAQAEGETLLAAIEAALAAQEPVADLLAPLDALLDRTGQKPARARLADRVVAGLRAYPERATPDLLQDRIMVLGDAATAMLEVQRLAEAGAIYQAVLGLVAQLPDPEGPEAARLAAGTYHHLGIVAEEQRDWATAEARYLKALEIFLAHQDELSAAKTYHQLGSVAQQQRDWATAEARYLKALEIFLAHQDEYEAAGTYHQLGSVAQEQRDWATAEARYLKALEIKLAHQDEYGAASTYHQFGIVAQQQRDWATAEARYLKALEIYLAHQDEYGAAGTYHNLGIVAQEQRDWATAEARYLKALEIYLAHQEEHNAGIALGSLARLVRTVPDRQSEILAALAAALKADEAAARRALAAAVPGTAVDSDALARLRDALAAQLPAARDAAWIAPPAVPLDWTEIPPAEILDAVALLSLLTAPAPSETDAESAGPAPLIPMLARAAPLPFQPGHRLVEVQIAPPHPAGTDDPAIASMVESEAGIVVLDGTSPPIHALNARVAPDFSEPAAREAYLRYFCAHLRGDDGAPFTLVDRIEDLPLAARIDPALTPPIAEQIAPLTPMPVAPDDPPDSHRYAATVLHAGRLFRSLFRLDPDGTVVMLDDTQLVEDTLPLRPMTYDGPFRAWKNQAEVEEDQAAREP